ncbi:MAG: hypothetical protein WD995_06105 [Gemmatimonadota bacterium]
MSQPTLRSLALCAGLLMAPGCYSYVPTDMAVVPPGEHVQLLVTREGSQEVAAVMDSNELRPSIRGQFVGREAESLLLRIPVSRDLEGMRPEIGQVVRIPEGEVLTVDRREFSKGKTAALLGGVAAAGAFLLVNIFDVFSDADPRDGGDPDLFIGLFRIPIG